MRPVGPNNWFVSVLADEVNVIATQGALNRFPFRKGRKGQTSDFGYVIHI